MAASIEDEGRDSFTDESVLAEINVTPLTDVFLVLLIIFMVTSTTMSQPEAAPRTAARVVLPQSSAPEPVSAKRTDPILTITRAGEIFLFARPIAPKELEPAIREALRNASSDTVLLRGDTGAMLGTAVKVMSVARKAGARNIQVLTSPDSK